MSSLPQTSAETGPAAAGLPLTRPQRSELLRLLALGDGVERFLASLRNRPAAADAGEQEAVLSAIAAATALDPGDRLVAPHGLLAAQMASGAEPDEVLALRLRERIREPRPRRPRVGIGPHSPAGIGAGIALALALERDGHGREAVLALIDRRWVTDDACGDALSLAHELALPVVVCAIDPGSAQETEGAICDRRDFEGIRAAVAESLARAREERRPGVVECAPVGRAEAAAADRIGRFRERADDPVSSYERRLMISGFSRAELDEVRRVAREDLDRALAGRLEGGPVVQRRDGAR